MSLKAFIAQENATISLFGGGEEPYPVNPKDLSLLQKSRLAIRLSSALSPEALTCDGELRGAKLIAKSKRLQKAKQELEDLGVTVKVE